MITYYYNNNNDGGLGALLGLAFGLMIWGAYLALMAAFWLLKVSCKLIVILSPYVWKLIKLLAKGIYELSAYLFSKTKLLCQYGVEYYKHRQALRECKDAIDIDQPSRIIDVPVER